MNCVFIRRLIQALPLAFLLGCLSETAQLNHISKTPMNFALSSTTPLAKAMVWGKSSNGNAFAKIIDLTQEDNYDWYPNGTWTIYAIGWETSDLTGAQNHCARIERKFEGPKETFPLKLEPATCDHTDFRGENAGSVGLGIAKLELCESIRGISNSNQKCTDKLDDGDRVSARGHAMSYRIRYRTFHKNGKSYAFGSRVYSSICRNATPSSLVDPDAGLAQESLANVPIGDGQSTPFYLELELFPGSSNCDAASHGSHVVALPNGLKVGSPTAVSVFDGTAAQKIYVQMGEAEICRGSALSQTFAGGIDVSSRDVSYASISNSSPRLICNEQQFLNLLQGTNSLQAVKLLRDIDLTGYYHGLNASYLDNYHALLPGSNFYPLGMNKSTAIAEDQVADPRYGFPYNFDGGGRTIKGLRIFMDPVVLGSLADIRTGFSVRRSGIFRRMKLENWEMSGHSFVSLLGRSSGSARAIEIINPKVTATGTDAGILFSAMFIGPGESIKQIRIRDIHLKGAINCGGIASRTTYEQIALNTFEMHDIAVDGVIDCPGGYTGGILGYSNSNVETLTIDLKRSRFEGTIKGVTRIGGLVGEYVNLSITASYSHAFLDAGPVDRTNIRMGGLVGGPAGASPTLRIFDSFVFSTGRFNCQAFNSGCLVGNIAGSFPGNPAAWTVSNSFHTGAVAAAYSLLDPGTNSVSPNFYGTVNVTADFRQSTEDIPRLLSEIDPSRIPDLDFTNPCLRQTTLSVSDLVLAGYGRSSRDPILICNGKQLAKVTDFPDRHYVIASPIFANFPVGDSSAVFTGSINGGNQPVFKAVIQKTGVSLPVLGVTSGTFSAQSWFKEIRGTIKNLYLKNPLLLGAATTNIATVLAIENSGTISDVRVEDLSSIAVPVAAGNVRGHSGLVVLNRGTINRTSVEGEMNVQADAAAVALTNAPSAKIIDSSADVNFLCVDGQECYKVYGFLGGQLGQSVRNFSGSRILGSAYSGNSTLSLFSVKNYEDAVTEDTHVKGRLHCQHPGCSALAISNDGIFRRAYSEADVRVISADPPAATETHLPSPGLSTSSETPEDILTRFPARWYLNASQTAGMITNDEQIAGLTAFWDFLVNPTTYFIAKDANVVTQRCKILSHVTPPLIITTEQGCGFNFGDSLVFGYEVPARPFHTVVPSPSLATFSVFTGINSLNEPVWVADLTDTGDLADVHRIRRDLYLNRTPSVAPPTWVHEPVKGLRLWHRYLKE